jgi:hypothetical protein
MKNKTKRAIALWTAFVITAAGGVYSIFLGLFLFFGLGLLWEVLVKKLWPDMPMSDLEMAQEKIKSGRMG